MRIGSRKLVRKKLKRMGDGSVTKIEVYGRGVSFSLTEITPEVAKELTENGITQERYDDLRASLRSSEMKILGLNLI